MNAPRKALPLPPIFFAISTVASLLLAGGVIGLTAPDLAPFLADRAVAVACLVAGVLLELWSIAIVVGAARRNQARVGGNGR